MRTILAILAVLLFAGWVLSEIEITSAEGTVMNQVESSQWRRTAQGWEQIEDWAPIAPPSVSLHPVIFGLFMLFISIFALIGFESPVPVRSQHPRK
ncbi:MAG: hypothetical protein PVH19_04320 [Planctomycetia bacterium]|jgi:hypothetical protein